MQTDEFLFEYTKNAEDDLKSLLLDKGKKVARKAVHEALKKMRKNLRHPSLNTHKYDGIEGPARKFSNLMLKIILLESIEFFGITDRKERK